MAENSDNSSLGNFSIEDTMEMGGNRELLDSLLSPETATSSPDTVTEIDKKVEKKVEKTTTADTTEKDDPSKIVNSFLEEEEEQETKEDKPKKEGDEPDEDESKEQNRFTALSKDLFKLGVFSKDEDEEEVEISTPEALLERFQVEGKKKAIEVVDTFLGQFGEDYQEAFDAIFVKGVNPKEYFGTYNTIEDFSSLDLSTEANQIAVIKQALVNQGYEPEEINAEVERVKNYGDLEAVAQRHHKVLVKNEAAKLVQLKKDSELKLQQQAGVKAQYLKNVQTVLQDKLKKNEFDGIPLNPKLAQELQDFLITDKYKTPSGETLTEFDRTILDLKRPENHEKKVKLALLLKILEKDPTLSTIQKAGVSKKADALFSEVARQAGKSSVKSDKVTTKPSSWF